MLAVQKETTATSVALFSNAIEQPSQRMLARSSITNQVKKITATGIKINSKNSSHFSEY